MAEKAGSGTAAHPAFPRHPHLLLKPRWVFEHHKALPVRADSSTRQRWCDRGDVPAAGPATQGAPQGCAAAPICFAGPTGSAPLWQSPGTAPVGRDLADSQLFPSFKKNKIKIKKSAFETCFCFSHLHLHRPPSHLCCLQPSPAQPYP